MTEGNESSCGGVQRKSPGSNERMARARRSAGDYAPFLPVRRPRARGDAARANRPERPGRTLAAFSARPAQEPASIQIPLLEADRRLRRHDLRPRRPTTDWV